MLILLSPAKTLDFAARRPGVKTSLPRYLPQSAQLMEILRQYDPARLAGLMGLSDKLAALNVARNLAWSEGFAAGDRRPAVFAFRGDVYQGLDADSLTSRDLRFAQDHLRIISGLYGLLRPLDLIQPYRLEMGTSLPNPAGRDLYAFWGDQLAQELNRELGAQKQQMLVNLASVEYFRALDRPCLQAQRVSPVFRDRKSGHYKVISFYAKKARGLMARWIIHERPQRVEDLAAFDLAGYRYAAAESRPGAPVFLRDAPG